MLGYWNRRDSLYTVVSSFEGVGIEGIDCTQWCSCFGIKEFHFIHGGVLISGRWIHCTHDGVLISGCWNRGVPLYTVVSLCWNKEVSLYAWWCPHFRVLK